MESEWIRADADRPLIAVAAQPTIRRYALRFALDGWRSPGQAPVLRHEAAQGIVLALLRHADAGMATALHDANERKALSIGPVAIRTLPGGLARADLEIAVWQARLGDLLDAALGGAADARLILNGVPALLVGWQSLGAWTTAAVLDAPPLPAVTVRFVSPTLFSFGRHPTGAARYYVVPEPGVVVASWLRAWKLTGDHSHDWLPTSPEELGRSIALDALRDVNTVTVTEPTAQLTGFVGDARYRWAGREPDGRSALAALARFAGICGTGAKTGRGFGQTLPLCPPPASASGEE